MRKVFNITKKDYDILPYLKKQPNMSQYIIKLIRQDMNNDKVLTRDEVIDIIEKYLSQKHLISDKTTRNDFPIDSVLNIVNMDK